MEPPPPPAPLADALPPEPPADTSSLGLGVALGLFGVPFGLATVVSSLGYVVGQADNAGIVPTEAWSVFAVTALLAGLGVVVGVPVVCYRRGQRRLGQGVLVGYGVLALVFGVCTAVVLTSLSGANFR